MSKHHHSQEDIYTSQVVQALEQKYCSSCSAAVVSSCLVSSQGLGARVVSRIYDGGRKAVYTAAVAAMMVQNLTPGAYAATSTITPGQTVSNLVIPDDGDITDLNVSGSTVDTTVNATGKEMIKSGGVASGTTVNSGGSQVVSRGGSAISTVINDGGSQIVNSSGLASNTQVSAGGVHAVNAGGSSLDFIQQSGGVLRLNIASKTFVSGQDASGQTLIASGGSALGWTLNDGVSQNLLTNAIAQDTLIKEGGNQNVSAGGSAINTTVSSGGIQNIFHNGSSFNVTQLSGGNINTRLSGGATTFVTGTNQNGETLSISNGVASNFIINEGGYQYITTTASAVNTIVNSGGIQRIGSSAGGGTAINTTISNGGSQYVHSGGVASNARVLDGGWQTVGANGSANMTQIENGGSQILSAAAVATSTTVSSGGAQGILSGGSSVDVTQLSGGNINTRLGGGDTTFVSGTNQNGETLSISNGVASNFIVNEGGYQWVYAGGIASNTTVLDGGYQSVSGGGIASNTTLSGTGELRFNESGVADTLNAQGGLIRVFADGQIVGNATLSNTEIIYRTAPLSNPLANLSIENLSANGVILNMNVDLENQEGDKLTVQSSYNGNAQISATNIGSSAQETTGDGIKLVEFSDPSVANGTFSLVGGTMVEGAYTYGLEQGTKAGEGKDYFLRSVDYAPIFKTMLNVPVMNVMVAQTGMNSLQRRLGDLQNMDNTGKKQGIWVRSYYRDVTVNDLAKTDMRLFGAEAGYDWLFRADEPTRLYAGVLVGYVNLNALETRKENGTYEKGDGETPSAGVYATLVNEEGWFVDLAARNFWTKLDLTSHNGSTPSPTYSPKRNVVAVSTEAGTNFIKSLSRNKFIRIEPKAEVAWMNAASGDTPVHNGVGDLHYEETNYLNGKAGVLISYNTKYGNDLLIEPLVELAYRYEFDGKGNVSYGGATEKSDLSGGSLEVNAGLNMQLTKDLYWYALGSYENGKKIEGWGVYAGVRYKFGGEDTTLPPGAVVQTQTAADKPATPKDQAALPKAGPEEVFHLLFKFGSDALEPAAVDAVRNFAKLYVSGKQTAPILLEGYTCDLGKPAYNKVLSRRRAEAVQKILIQQGISKDKITVKAYGDTQFVKNGFGGRKDYRRVVVSINDK